MIHCRPSAIVRHFGTTQNDIVSNIELIVSVQREREREREKSNNLIHLFHMEYDSGGVCGCLLMSANCFISIFHLQTT